ncbi:MAG: ParB/RepB/Spo0J family partition protein, partial [Rheinheimera sp.]|nr:ParB/RepB/Spo0J family partition protein [Rheinheimera sp.]
MTVKKRGLGRGLDALLTSNRTSNSDTATPSSSALQQLPVEFLTPGKYQPRKDMSQEALDDLASSIRAQGVIQPIVVRPLAKNKFEIIAGERRWRASQLAQLAEVPCIIKDVP